MQFVRIRQDAPKQRDGVTHFSKISERTVETRMEKHANETRKACAHFCTHRHKHHTNTHTHAHVKDMPKKSRLSARFWRNTNLALANIERKETRIPRKI